MPASFFFFYGEVALGNGRSVPAVLLANKCDQRDHGLCPKLPKLENFSRDYGFIGWYETSAKARPHCLLPAFLFMFWRWDSFTRDVQSPFDLNFTDP